MLFKKKICLALGGGGARGLLHLGILKVLEENNLQPDMIIGTSMGAIIGGAYAVKNHSMARLIEIFESMLSSKEFEDLGLTMVEDNHKKAKLHFVQKFKKSIAKYNFYRKMFTHHNLIENHLFEKLLRLVLPEKRIEDLPVKFAVVCLDLVSRQEVILDQGPLIKCVLASSAIPGIIEPVKHKNMMLVDGGWIDKVPVPAACRLHADKIIAIDAGKKNKKRIKYKNGFQILRIAESITNDYLKDLQILGADLVLQLNLGIHWYDFSKFNKLVRIGEKIARENLAIIKKIFRKQRGLF